MLSDNVVNAFQKIMEKQFPEANSLQDPIFGQTLSFKVQKNKPFVQVLHDGKLHWKPISTCGCNEGEVCYIDSLFKGRIAECHGGKPKTIFMQNKWLSAVNAENGFTECVNEYQRIFLRNKRLNGFAEVVQIISSSHSQI